MTYLKFYSHYVHKYNKDINTSSDDKIYLNAIFKIMRSYRDGA